MVKYVEVFGDSLLAEQQVVLKDHLLYILINVSANMTLIFIRIFDGYYFYIVTTPTPYKIGQLIISFVGYLVSFSKNILIHIINIVNLNCEFLFCFLYETVKKTICHHLAYNNTYIDYYILYIYKIKNPCFVTYPSSKTHCPNGGMVVLVLQQLYLEFQSHILASKTSNSTQKTMQTLFHISLYFKLHHVNSYYPNVYDVHLFIVTCGDYLGLQFSFIDMIDVHYLC
ncbi:hypothetical protein ACJX0J_011289 [Zea mays]